MTVDTRKGAILRIFRLLRLTRVARVAKLVFRNEKIRLMVAKAFSGLDAILSLTIFMLFFFTVCSIAAVNLFYTCDDGASLSHKPNFRSFGQSFLTTFQVFTTDSWGALMVDTMDCAGPASSIYFVIVIFVGNFVLGNMYIAIFIENLEISDEIKRNKQIEAYILALNTAGAEGGVTAVKNSIGKIEHALEEPSSTLAHMSFNSLLK
eukprot:SAG11_NODE_10535_length_824_cov_0.917241_2_plen_206_part_01